MGNMSESTIEALIPKIKLYFATQPVVRAWLFGSFSRGEETAQSDIDIIVDFDKSAHVGLLKYSCIYGDLKELLGREIDLVKNGSIKPFAANNVERDKILIYVRAN